ncbi:MAG: hypothetical protein LBJ64_10365 [Deltaproteobacteria bacterium]|jgi:hypothetical protein|nr:hypothetical protein [Deltaproteobacteria bacterium]
MSDFPNTSMLKSPNRRDQGPKGLHVMILKSDGNTRHLRFSPLFFWFLGLLFIAVVLSLAWLAHQYVELDLERKTLLANLNTETRINEIRDYARTVNLAPEEARRILELLDRAIVMSESGHDEEEGLIGIPDPETAEAPVENSVPDAPPESAEAPDDAPPAPPVEEAATPLQEAWQKWRAQIGSPQTPMETLDIEDFEVTASGQVTFLLRQSGEPGRRVRGRVLVVLAVSDANGKITLLSAPQTNMSAAQGWDKGSKYNIVASKLMRVKAEVPAGSKILNAEVVAWEEDTKELVFRKKILIEEK